MGTPIAQLEIDLFHQVIRADRTFKLELSRLLLRPFGEDSLGEAVGSLSGCLSDEETIKYRYVEAVMCVSSRQKDAHDT